MFSQARTGNENNNATLILKNPVIANTINFALHNKKFCSANVFESSSNAYLYVGGFCIFKTNYVHCYQYLWYQWYENKYNEHNF